MGCLGRGRWTHTWHEPWKAIVRGVIVLCMFWNRRYTMPWPGCMAEGGTEGTFPELAFAVFWQLWLLFSSLSFPRECVIAMVSDVDTEGTFPKHAPGVAYNVMIKGAWDGVAWMSKLKGDSMIMLLRGGLRTVAVVEVYKTKGAWDGVAWTWAEDSCMPVADPFPSPWPGCMGVLGTESCCPSK